MEGLLAFFMESAFLGLWIFGWKQPVGYRVNPVTHRAQLTSIVALLTNSTVLAAWPHVFLASFLVAGTVVIAASAWHLARSSDTALFRPVMRLGLAVTLAAGIATAVTGDLQARLMDSQQPSRRRSRIPPGRSSRSTGPRSVAAAAGLYRQMWRAHLAGQGAARPVAG